jgi:hypothetical protein
VTTGRTMREVRYRNMEFRCSSRIILESDPVSIAQRVQLRHDDVPLAEQTVSQVSVDLSNETKRPSDSCRSVFLSGIDSFAEFRWIDMCKSIVVLDRRFP